MKLNSIGTAEDPPQIHRSEDGLRSLCGAKVLPLTAEKQEAVDLTTTCGEFGVVTGCESCLDYNVKDTPA